MFTVKQKTMCDIIKKEFYDLELKSKRMMLKKKDNCDKIFYKQLTTLLFFKSLIYLY